MAASAVFFCESIPRNSLRPPSALPAFSFNNVQYWMENIQKHAGPQTKKLLLGNKIDGKGKKARRFALRPNRSLGLRIALTPLAASLPCRLNTLGVLPLLDHTV